MDQGRLDQQIELDEGYRAGPYKDSRGLWTIADGRCVETAPFTGAEWKFLLDGGHLTVQIDHLGSQFLLHQKEQQAVAALKTLLPQWDTMGDVRQNALIEECYQLGNSFLVGWPHTLAAIRNNDWDGVANAEMESEWAQHQTPQRASKLIQMLRSGQWPS
jgi:GH24 family phage-related lysozyme (muramidase)